MADRSRINEEKLLKSMGLTYKQWADVSAVVRDCFESFDNLAKANGIVITRQEIKNIFFDKMRKHETQSPDHLRQP